MPKNETLAGVMGSVLGELAGAAAGEAGRAIESARHELVDRAWFGRTTPECTPSAFEAWAGLTPVRDAPGMDAIEPEPERSDFEQWAGLPAVGEPRAADIEASRSEREPKDLTHDIER